MTNRNANIEFVLFRARPLNSFFDFRTSHPPTGDRPNWTERGEVTCGQVTLTNLNMLRDDQVSPLMAIRHS